MRILTFFTNFAFILMFGLNAFAVGEGAQSFTLDGRLYADAAATTPLVDADVKLVFQILNPSQNCVIYEETFSHFDTSIGNGYFTLQVGSAVGAAKRSALDTGHSMSQVFSNTIANLSGRTFAGSACGYSPNPGDQRYLRVLVTPSSDNTTRILSPNMVLDSVPMALVAERAETVQGLSPANLLQVNTTSSQVLSQTNLETVFTSSNYSSLTALLNGSSTVFSKPAANGTTPLAIVSSPASPAAGQIWYDSGSIKFYNGSSTQTLGVSGSGITSLAAGTGLNVGAGPGGTITSTGTLNIDVGTTAGKIVQVATGNKLPAIDGSQLTNLPAPTSGTIGGSGAAIVGASGSFGSTSTGQLSLYDHATTNTNYITLKTPATATLTADYTLTLPAALPGSGGQVLTSDTSGQLSWSSPSTGSVTSVTSGGAPIVIGGTGSAPTVSVSAATTSANGVVTLAANGGTTASTVVQATDSRLSDSRAPNGTASGDLSGSFPSPTVAAISGKAVTYTSLTTGDFLKYNGTGWVNTALSSANLSNDNNLLKASNMPANCASGSTLTFSSPTGTWTCTSIPDATASAKGLMQVGTGLAVSSGNVSLASGVIATPGTYTKVTVDTYGRVTTGANISGSDVTTALGYTPVNKAGDVMTGTLGLASYTNTTEATLVGAFLAADKGKTWFNSDIKQIRMWDGSQIVDVAAGPKPTSSEDGKSLRWNDSTKTWEYFTAAAGSSSYWSAATGGINYGGGNVGINNASPSVPLDVTGDIKSSTAVYAPSGFIGKVYTQSNAATAPGFSFVYSNDTGMFEAGTAGSHKLGFSTAGSERVRIDETGKVGIGTTSPNTKLEVASGTANTSGVRLTNLTSSAPTSTGQAIGVDASGNIVTITAGGGGTVTSVTSGGAPIVVGGTAAAPTVSVSDASTSAKGVVQLAASGGTTAGTVVEANDSRLSDSRAPSGTAGGDLSSTYPNPTVAKINGKAVTYTSITSGDYLKYNGTGWVNSSFPAGASYWTAATGGIARTTGNVGIGSLTSVYAPLQVYRASTTANGPTEVARLTGSYDGSSSGPMLRFTNTTGLTSTNPNAGEYNLAGVQGFDDNDDWGGGLAFLTAAATSGGGNLTTKMVVRSSGNVGIGTTSPGDKLHVAGKIRATHICYTDGTNCKDISTAWSGGSVTSVTSGGAPIVVGGTAAAPTVSVSTASTSANGVVTLASNGGTTSGTVVQADDSRLTNSRSPNGTASGDLSGSYPSPTVAAISGKAVTYTSLTSGDFLKYNGTGWVNTALSSASLSNDSNLLKASNMPANCSAGSTLTFSSPTGTWTCTTVTGLDAGAIATGTIADARLPASATYWQSATGGINYAGGKVGIGVAAPANPLSVAGVIQSTTGGFKFPDGTTQTTAVLSGSSTPAFFAHKNGTDQTVTSSVWNKLTWSAKTYDTTNAFASDRFTPLVPGKYLVSLNVYCSSTASYCHAMVYKNGSNIFGNVGASTANGYAGTATSAVVDMNGTTDYLEAYVYSYGTVVNGSSQWTNFSAILVSGTTTANSGSGTANYVPLWSNSTTLGNSPIAVSGSNVGIGTTSPAAALHVTGNSGAYSVTGTSGSPLNVQTTGATSYPMNAYFNATGTTDHVVRHRYANNSVNKWQINYGDDIAFYSDAPGTGSYVTTTVMRQNGNLEVAGTAKVTAVQTATGQAVKIMTGTASYSTGSCSMGGCTTFNVNFGYTFNSAPVVTITGTTYGAWCNLMKLDIYSTSTSGMTVGVTNPTSATLTAGPCTMNWQAIGY